MTSRPSDPQADRLQNLKRALKVALEGGQVLLPRAWPKNLEPLPGTAVTVATSGSTGEPKWVCLSARAVRSSALAAAERMGGSGHWLLTLPPNHIAGLNVVARAVVAGAELWPMPPGSFTPEAFAAATAAMPKGPRYVSLVPTQLGRLVAEAGPGLAALASFDAVLVGGTSTTPALLAAARSAGVRLIETYGMAETCGGCVYDGQPLEGVAIELAPDDRIELSGPMLALGYAGDAAGLNTAFFERAGRRWYRTSDLGKRLAHGRLSVRGRSDNALSSGGTLVMPEAIETRLRALPWVQEALVVGLDNPEWGHEVTALVKLARGQAAPDDLLPALRQAVKTTLDSAHAPRAAAAVSSLPFLASGKPDRAAAFTLAQKLDGAGHLERL
ncbi:MAG: AMP-binding protein [Bifidobacteriaceae bacterium]|jgi:O-succinylbenzoic acid--CoA ligase|nr:AMP-binding protein [Bifidobacteriaceae bacterium]